MQRHGGKTVFFGRFVADPPLHRCLGRRHRRGCRGGGSSSGMRPAGSRGRRRRARLVLRGKAAADAIQRYGIFAAAGVAVLFVVGWIGFRLASRRLEDRL